MRDCPLTSSLIYNIVTGFLLLQRGCSVWYVWKFYDYLVIMAMTQTGTFWIQAGCSPVEDYMFYYIIKVALSALVIVIVSEVAKHSSLFGALIAALPLTSLLAIFWMHVEKVETEKIAQLSQSIFWLVLPSLAFFLAFPFLLYKGLHFWVSLGLSATLTIVIYFIMLWILKACNILIM